LSRSATAQKKTPTKKKKTISVDAKKVTLCFNNKDRPDIETQK